MNLQQLLKQIKQETGMNNETIAQALQVSKSTVARWSNGDTKNLKKETLKRLSSLLKVDAATLLCDEIFIHQKPLLGYVKAGYDMFASENYLDSIEVSNDDFKRGDYFLKVEGDSMDLAHIHDGDLIYVKQCNDVNSGKIAVVLVGDEVTVKKVIKKENMLILEACNPKYENRYFSSEEVANIPVKIIGKVIYARTDF